MPDSKTDVGDLECKLDRTVAKQSSEQSTAQYLQSQLTSI